MDVFDSLVAENRRLKRELVEHRERLRALERSRWYRLNPRRWWPRHLADTASTETRERQSSDERVRDPAPPDQIPRFRAEVVSRGSFTENWFLPKGQGFHPWEPLLRELDGRAARILEIGSFEGLSTCFLLWRLPDAKLTCVDTFGGGIEHRGPETATEGLEARFDTNVALVDATRVRKLAGDSRRMLLDLASEDQRFDFVFIDGSHLGLDVLVDASLAWQLLEPGGTLVFDDYNWSELGDDALLRPGPAIDAFLGLVAGKYELLSEDIQVIVRKTGESGLGPNSEPAARRRKAGTTGTE